VLMHLDPNRAGATGRRINAAFETDGAVVPGLGCAEDSKSGSLRRWRSHHIAQSPDSGWAGDTFSNAGAYLHFCGERNWSRARNISAEERESLKLGSPV